MRGARIARVGCFLLACIVASTSLAAGPTANDADLGRLRSRIEKLQAELSAAEESRSEAQGELRASARSLNEAHRALFALGERRRALEAELSEIGRGTRDIRASLARQEALAGRLLRLRYRQGGADGLRLALEGRDPAAVARHVAYYGYVQQASARAITELRRKADALAQLQREAANRREELAQNEAAQSRQASALDKERRARVALLGRLAGEIARNRREMGRLKRDEARLARLVAQLSRELSAVGTPPDKPRGRTIEHVADASSSARPFESLKGLRRLPARGELVNRYGGQREESGATWKGLFIRAVSGETVHAVADGRVVYADWLRGFGNLLILDHGKGFMSLYANNEGLVRQVGESVRSGDSIARVGATGDSVESGLYFELRRDGKPFDPMAWVAP